MTGLGPVDSHGSAGPDGSQPPAEDEGCITLRLLVLRVEGAAPAPPTSQAGQEQQERHYAKYYRTALPVAGKRRLRLEVWDRPYVGGSQGQGPEEEERRKVDGVVLVYSRGDR